MKDIQVIILDVDGVIVGEKIGINSPNPHKLVIQRLLKLRENGVKIVLCTAKPYFSIIEIIKSANLDNFHITDGGSVIINPIQNIISQKHLITNEIAKQVLQKYLEQDIYVECYTIDNYFIQKNNLSNITTGHSHVLQKSPIILDDLTNLKSREITKIMPIAKNEEEKCRIAKIFAEFQEELTLSWGVHPVLLPLQFGIITAPNISKKQGAIYISEKLNTPFANILGIGDSLSDWQFIELCKYGAAMGNAKKSLKQLVLSKKKKSFIGASVDENGILEIFDYFC